MAIAALTLLSGCDQPAKHPALRDARLERLIPAHEFVFNRHGYSGFHFSPAGDRLAWFGPSGWRRALHVRTEASGEVRRFQVGGGSTMVWSADSRRLLILDDKSGAENHRLYRLDVDAAGAQPVDLTPYDGVRVMIHRILADDPEHILILHNRRDRTQFDLYRINLSDGTEQLVSRNPGRGVAPVTDAAGKLLGWREPRGPARPRGVPLPPELRERSALAQRIDDTSQVLGFSRDLAYAWVVTNRDRDRVALLRVNRATGAYATVFEDPKVDLGRTVSSRVSGEPVLAIAHPGYPRVAVLDAALQRALAPLMSAHGHGPFGLSIVSMDASEQRLVVLIYTHANHQYVLLDRSNGSGVTLGASRSEDFARAMVPVEPVEIRARDGMRLPAYLLRPHGVAGKPLPLVILVHGGPWGRVTWMDPDQSEDMLRAQFLANRGYAVLAVNFRGSTGYGRSFLEAGIGEIGRRMQDDLSDAAQWAVQQGLADPERLAIWGHSYGGYAVLMALARSPREFACGVSFAGPSDLATLIESFPAHWELELNQWYRFVGDPAVAQDRARMEEVSPINLVERFERPLLVIQGARDVRVRREQSESLVRRLREHGKPVRYVSIPAMGHSTGYWPHHLLVLRETERFLADCLQGRAARFDRMQWIARLTGRLPLLPN